MGSGELGKAADHQYLFPLAGAIIGILTYLAGYLAFLYLPSELAILLTLLSIYLIIGLIHLDGLADFSDGVMAHGNKKRKVEVMKDPKTGIAGTFSVIFLLLFTYICLKIIVTKSDQFNLLGFQIPMYPLFGALILSEISAKLSLNTSIFVGNKLQDGIGSFFIDQASITKYSMSFIIAVLFGLLVARERFFVVIVGAIVGLIVVNIANRNFGGVNGDVMGAANELARAGTLFIWMVVI